MITVPKSFIQYVDAIVLIFYLVLIISGARKGFLRQLISLAGTLLSWYLSWRYCDLFSSRFSLVPKSLIPEKYSFLMDLLYPSINRIAWFLLLMLVIRIIFALLEQLFRGLEKLPLLKQVSMALGGILGAIGATVWILVFCIILNTPLFANGREVEENSRLGDIRTKVTQTFTSLDLPYTDAKEVNEVLHFLKDKEGADLNIVGQWLDEHGHPDISTQEGEDR